MYPTEQFLPKSLMNRRYLLDSAFVLSKKATQPSPPNIFISWEIEAGSGGGTEGKILKDLDYKELSMMDYDNSTRDSDSRVLRNAWFYSNNNSSNSSDISISFG